MGHTGTDGPERSGVDEHEYAWRGSVLNDRIDQLDPQGHEFGRTLSRFDITYRRTETNLTVQQRPLHITQRSAVWDYAKLKKPLLGK